MIYKAINNKLHKQLSTHRLRAQNFGVDRAKRIGKRIDELAAAKTLADISTYPPARLHRLHGTKEGLFAVDVSANYRLEFAGFDRYNNQTIIMSDIIAIVFVAVEDYH